MGSPAALELTRDEWKAAALDVIDGIPTGASLTADDVRSVLPHAFPASILGGVFMAAKASGIIAPVGHTASNTRTRRHGSQRVWVKV